MTYVYVIAREANGMLRGPCKIGISNDPEKRIRTLKTGHWDPLAVVETWEMKTLGAAVAMERSLHALLRGYRLEGEWFDIEPQVAAMYCDGYLLDREAKRGERKEGIFRGEFSCRLGWPDWHWSRYVVC